MTQRLPTLQEKFIDYAQVHRNPKNQLTHLYGIPMITISLLGILSHVDVFSGGMGILESDVFRLDLGVAFILGSLVYYLMLDWKLSLPFGLLMFGFYAIGRSLPWSAIWVLQAVGWFLQLWGHKHFEKKSPAFFRSISHIWIGPFWIFAKLIGHEGARESLARVAMTTNQKD
jgi:uncharacterized membrane protein YGL010W